MHVACIILVAFLFRLCLVWYLLGLDWWYNTGEGYEHAMLWDYLRSDRCYMPPGQYLFAGAINQWFGHSAFSVLRLSTILLSALMSVNIYRIGRDSYGMAVGAAAGYLSCISLSFAYHSWTFYPTILAATLFSFFVVHFLRLLACPTSKDALLAGLFLGFGALTRTELLLFLPLSLLWFLLVQGIKRDTMLHGSALLIACCLIIGCWSLRNYRACDRFLLISSNAAVNYFIGNNPLQKGGYFPPHPSDEQKDDYLRAGLTYDLEHPGWFVTFFIEKLKLCWSRETSEHPLHLLQSRLDGSTVKLFNDSFSKSLLGKTIADESYAGIYGHIRTSYSFCIDMLWLFAIAGVLSCHVWWRTSYFLLMICCTLTLVLALFISGSQRWSLPLLPYVYLFTAAGIVFVCRVFWLQRSEVSLLVRRNALLLLALIMMCLTWLAMVTFSPGMRYDTIKILYPWNIFSTGGESVRIIIVESQLAYPVRRSALRSDAFTVKLGDYHVPHLDVAGSRRSDAKYYFKEVNDLLCNNAIIINIPNELMRMMMRECGFDNEDIKAGSIIEALQGKITISYVPAWQFRPAVESVFTHLLEQLRHHSKKGAAHRI
jgi:hypothetical protein